MMESSLNDAESFSAFLYYVWPFKVYEDYAQTKWIYRYFINIIALSSNIAFIGFWSKKPQAKNIRTFRI